MATIVMALGGNALGNTPQEQLRLVNGAAKVIVDLVEEENNVVVVHGNGPQVGMINLGLSVAAETGAIQTAMPLPECGAMSQGYIGYHLQNSIQNELQARGLAKSAVTVVTQVLVDAQDPAFSAPTKPIGMFYTEEQAQEISKEKGYVMVEDAGRGYRQAVPSPLPVDVVERDAIQALLNAGQIVITVGGGGIPVISRDGALIGAPAVIDKDFAAAKLAELLHADILVILTGVERVAIHYGTSEQTFLSHMSIEEARRYMDDGEFAPGSMLPKVQAAVDFACSGGKAIIAALEKAGDAVRGKNGTVISVE